MLSFLLIKPFDKSFWAQTKHSIILIIFNTGIQKFFFQFLKWWILIVRIKPVTSEILSELPIRKCYVWGVVLQVHLCVLVWMHLEARGQPQLLVPHVLSNSGCSELGPSPVLEFADQAKLDAQWVPGILLLPSSPPWLSSLCYYTELFKDVLQGLNSTPRACTGRVCTIWAIASVPRNFAFETIIDTCTAASECVGKSLVFANQNSIEPWYDINTNKWT